MPKKEYLNKTIEEAETLVCVHIMTPNAPRPYIVIVNSENFDDFTKHISANYDDNLVCGDNQIVDFVADKVM